MLTKSYFKLIVAVAIIVGIFSLLGSIALVILWHTKLTPFQDYALVIDAGSTHSTIFVYSWPADKSDGSGLTSQVHQVNSCPLDIGPITTVVNPTQNDVKQYFDSEMTTCINVIPSSRRSRALIFLGATAGLRLINITNPSYTSSLLNATRAYFGTLGLLFRAPESQVRIISGSEEGLSGWISINILMHQLFENNQPLETYGVLDMGGASTQISFIAPSATSERYTMNLFNTNYDVYSHSYLCYGQEQTRLVYLGQLVKHANDTLSVDDPCLQSHYVQNMTYDQLFSTACVQEHYVPPVTLNKSMIFSFVGTGDFQACKASMLQRFNKSSCSSSNCTFDNVYQPIPVSPSLKFIAMSGWYSAFHNLEPNISLSLKKDHTYNFTSTNLTQINSAMKAICEQSWSHVHKPDEHRPLLCFRSVYQWTLFEFGYSMNDENLKNLQILKTIDSKETGWALGYMINQTNYLEGQYRPARLLTRGEFIGLLVFSLLLLIISTVVTIITIYVYKKRRNQ